MWGEGEKGCVKASMTQFSLSFLKKKEGGIEKGELSGFIYILSSLFVREKIIMHFNKDLEMIFF